MKLKGDMTIIIFSVLKIFDCENEFHAKNNAKVWERQSFIEKLGGVNNLCTINSDTYGWLMNFINFVSLTDTNGDK